MTDHLTSKTWAERIATDVVERVCELPDYNSPDDQPELLQCTTKELHACVLNALERTAEPPDARRENALRRLLDWAAPGSTPEKIILEALGSTAVTKVDPHPWRKGDCVEWNGMKGVIRERPRSDSAWVDWRDDGSALVRLDALSRRDCDCDDRAPVEKDDGLWNPFGNDGMRHMENADVIGGATDETSRPREWTSTEVSHVSKIKR